MDPTFALALTRLTGPTAVAVGSFGAATAVVVARQWTRAAWRRIQAPFCCADGYERLRNLTADERALLRRFFAENTRQCRLSMKRCYELEAAGIIFKPGQTVRQNVGEDDVYAAYVIMDWVWDYISEHPELIE